MPKYLIVNADDFGITASVSRGILESHQQGIVTSTTVMINMPAAEAAIHTVHETAPGLGLGLHINLTLGRPVLPAEHVPSLVDAQGVFWPFATGLARMHTFTPGEVAAEINAQYARFIAVAGHKPDHLDSHQFVASIYPAAFDALLKLAAQEQLPVRSAATFLDAERAKALMQNALEVIPEVISGDMSMVDVLIAQLQQVYAANARPTWTDHFGPQRLGTSDMCGMYLEAINTLQDGVTELMCHPGYIEDPMDDPYTTGRVEELRALTSAEVKQAVERSGAQLITFAELPG